MQGLISQDLSEMNWPVDLRNSTAIEPCQIWCEGILNVEGGGLLIFFPFAACFFPLDMFVLLGPKWQWKENKTWTALKSMAEVALFHKCHLQIIMRLQPRLFMCRGPETRPGNSFPLRRTECEPETSKYITKSIHLATFACNKVRRGVDKNPPYSHLCTHTLHSIFLRRKTQVSVQGTCNAGSKTKVCLI